MNAALLNRLARANGITDKIQLAEYELNFAKLGLSISDVLSILQSNISDESKKSLLVMNGYSEDDAAKLVIKNNSQQ